VATATPTTESSEQKKEDEEEELAPMVILVSLDGRMCCNGDRIEDSVATL
jgi:hypothetical protein